MNDRELWSKLLGEEIESFTYSGTTYTVAVDETGGTWTCMDFRIRKGSWHFVVNDEYHVQGCKHMELALEKRGFKVKREFL
jgi:phosphatidate phosphatase PAH1